MIKRYNRTQSRDDSRYGDTFLHLPNISVNLSPINKSKGTCERTEIARLGLRIGWSLYRATKLPAQLDARIP